MGMLQLGIEAVERGLMPDALTRLAIRRLCRARLRSLQPAADDDRALSRNAFSESLRSGPIALLPEAANEQHYELPAEFFAEVLGPRGKYSCCFWPDSNASLAEAEEAALAITCQRAELADGQDILELGCGWGSLSLWMAERYPCSRITAVSNSTSQRHYVEAAAESRGLRNLTVITADINHFDPVQHDPALGSFDRVVSVEMFEHMRNLELLLERIASWLRVGGKLFTHIFCHRSMAYSFDSEGDSNWMGRYFFSGGMMPSAKLLMQFDRSLAVRRHWIWNGQHYQRTAEAWLANLDARRQQVLRILQTTYGNTDAARWLQRWRMFFLSVSELFGYAQGEEWFVSHYLLEPSRRGD